MVTGHNQTETRQDTTYMTMQSDELPSNKEEHSVWWPFKTSSHIQLCCCAKHVQLAHDTARNATINAAYTANTYNLTKKRHQPLLVSRHNCAHHRCCSTTNNQIAPY